MNKQLVTTILAIAIMISVLGVDSHEAYAADSKLKVSTINTTLESHKPNIDRYKGQVSSVNKKTMIFVKELAFPAYQSGQDYGLYPSITIAQAVLESGSGTSGLSIAPYHNLFGIKGFYEGQSVQMKTKEDDGSGNMYEIYANFKSYPNWESSLRDHDKLLRHGLNGFYSGAWRENARTPEQAANYLEGRYATDTNYANKLMEIINTYNLERFDKQLDERDLAWLNSDSLDPWETPEIKDYTPNKIQTWASGFKDAPLEFVKGLIAADEINTKLDKNIKVDNVDNVDQHYVETTLSLKEDFTNKSIPRYKRNPKIGDIAVYKTENGDNEVVEKYAIVEGFRANSMLISEGVRSDNEFHSVYRIIQEESYNKFEFINSELIDGFERTEDVDNLEENKVVVGK